MKSSEIKKSKINKAIGSNLLVAIGINTYERIHGNLDNCVSDASLVFDTFSKEEYLLMNSNSCKILSDNQDTTKNEILNKLQKIVAMRNSNVNIIIYYSGHGCIIDDVFYFVATDSNDSKEKMISLDDVLNIINSVEKRNVSIWIDACRKIVKTKSVNEESFNFKKTYIEKSRGMGIIYSCSKGEYSLDSFNDKKISVFTSLLIDTLKGCKTALKNNRLTVRSMFDYIYDESIKASKENIHINQHPEICFEGSDIVYAALNDCEIKETSYMKHQFYSLEKKIQNAMEELRFQIEAVIIEKGICIDGFESYTNDNLSIKIVISVCEELICQGYQLHSKWETVLSSIYFISNCFEEKIALNISLSDENKIIDDIWNFLYSIPTYFNN